MRHALQRGLRETSERVVSALSATPNLAALRIAPGRAGFFGEVFCALNGIRRAEAFGLMAHMAWGRKSPYFERKHSRDGDAWRSFFAVSTYDFRKNQNKIRPLFSITFKPGAHDFSAYPGMSTRRSLARALHNWCPPHPEIARAADKAESQLFSGRPMLGVHVRLTDAAAGAEDRKSVPLSQYFAAVDDWLRDRSEAGIFLATDEARVISAFEARYGERVVYQACLRSEDGTSIHGHYDRGLPGSPHQKGREVLLDALLLARTAHLIRTHSRVTAFSLCWSPDLSYRDLEFEITGVNRTPWLHEREDK